MSSEPLGVAITRERQREGAMYRIDGEVGILREFAVRFRTLGHNIRHTAISFKENEDSPRRRLAQHLLDEAMEIEARITRLLITFGELEKAGESGADLVP